MIPVNYCLQEGTSFNERGERVPIYGIAVRDSEKTLLSYPDLFFDCEQARALVDACNTGRLAPAQLPDVLEDLLAK